jgi:FPC/CPF motif-containing protein YcgG
MSDVDMQNVTREELLVRYAAGERDFRGVLSFIVLFPTPMILSLLSFITLFLTPMILSLFDVKE